MDTIAVASKEPQQLLRVITFPCDSTDIVSETYFIYVILQSDDTCEWNNEREKALKQLGCWLLIPEMCSDKSFRTIHNNIETGGMIMKVAQQQPNIEREVLILIELDRGKLQIIS